MAFIVHNPSTVAPPVGRYNHGIEVPPNARWLYTAGQVGIDRKGKVPAGIEKQTEQAWKNVLGVLKSAGMGVGDIVRTNIYVTDARLVAGFRAARDRVVPGFAGASTLVVVTALADPAYLVEIEAVAAKAD